MRKYRYAILISLFTVLTVAGPSEAAFKDPGWGARPTGMGGAFTAVADDSNTMFFNPAGLANIKTYDACAMHAGLFTGLDEVSIGLSLVSFAMPLHNSGGAGISWTNLNARDLYNENAFTVAYGHRFLPNLSGGVGLKYLGQGYTLDRYAEEDEVFKDGDYSDAFTADLGLLYKPQSDITLALSGINVIPADIGRQYEDIVPTVIRAGAAYRIPNMVIMDQLPVRNIVTAVDFSWRFQDWGDTEDKLTVNMGVEAWLLDEMLPVRAGADLSGSGIKNIALGTGFLKEISEVEMSIDYSFMLPVNSVRDTYGSHRVSLSGKF